MRQIARKKIITLLLLIVGSSCSARDFEDQTLQINVGPTFNFARYRLGCMPKIQGYLAGIHVDFAHGRPSKWYANAQFDGRWNAGYICSNNDEKLQIKDYRPELKVGYNFFFGEYESFVFTPAVGLGYYVLSAKLKPECVTRRYSNVNVPVGFDFNWRNDANTFQAGLLALYRIDARTRLKFKMASMDMCEKFTLCRSHGAHVEVPLTWFLTNDRRVNFLAKVVPFFDWNTFGKVAVKNSNNLMLDAPRLKQWYLGLHVDVGIQF